MDSRTLDSQTLAKEALLIEYQLVRTELLERTKWRDTILFSSLSILGAALAFAFQQSSTTALSPSAQSTPDVFRLSLVLYLLPSIGLMLAFVWCSAELRVLSMIQTARHVRDDLNSLAAEASKNNEDRSNLVRVERRSSQLLQHGLRAPGWISITRRYIELLASFGSFVIPGILSQLLLSRCTTPFCSNSPFAEAYILNWVVLMISACIVFLTSYFRSRLQREGRQMKDVKPWVGAILVHSNGEILLMQRDNKPGIPNPGKWGIVGGLAEGRETPAEAMKREVLEEVAYVVTKYDPMFEEYDVAEKRKRHVFRVPIATPITELVLGEGQAFGYFSLHTALRMDLGPYTRKYLEDYSKLLPLGYS